MKSIQFVLALVMMVLVTFMVGAPLAAARQVAPRPNIVYIMSDDQGWKDVGFHGSDIKTPNLDRLARGGARLERFYTEPFCTPTRAALLTGRYPFRYGLQTAAIPSGASYGLATDEWLLPQALKEVGYETAIVGKWHLGHANRKYWPLQRGFDSQYGPFLGEIDHFTHRAHGKLDWYRNDRPLAEKGYDTLLLGQDAVKLIEHHDPKTPLFLYLTFTAPHAPYQAPPKYLNRYKNISDPHRRAYAAMITVMDEEIGRVVAALDKRGMRKNTLIIFHSDNGGTRSAKFSGESNTSKITLPPNNGPYRDGKGSLYEGGMRVVALANWPGHIKAGSVVDQIIHVVDMYPTLASLAGASLAKCKKPFDGLNVWPTISAGQPSPRKEVAYDIEPFRAALSEGDWKLVWKVTLPPLPELYNLAQDPSEKTDLARENPQKVAELQQRVVALSREAVEPLFIAAIMKASKKALFGSVATANPENPLEEQP